MILIHHADGRPPVVVDDAVELRYEVQQLRQQLAAVEEQALLRGRLALSLADQRDAMEKRMVDDGTKHAFLAGASESLSRKRMLELFFAAVMPKARKVYRDAILKDGKAHGEALARYELTILDAIKQSEGGSRPADICLHNYSTKLVGQKLQCGNCDAVLVPVLGDGR